MIDKKILKRRHRRLWLWLAKTGSFKKRDWIEWIYNGGKVPLTENQCFACKSRDQSVSQICPIPWLGKVEICEGQCEAFGSLYYEWSRSDEAERKRIAKEIAELWK